MYLLCVANDLPARIGTMPDCRFHVDLPLTQRLHEAVQILPPRLNFRGRRLRPVNLAGNAFFHVQQIHPRMVARRETGGVAQGEAVQVRVVERDQNAAVFLNGNQFRRSLLEAQRGRHPRTPPIGVNRDTLATARPVEVCERP